MIANGGINQLHPINFGTNNIKDKKVVIMDDLLATGGTMQCAKDLIESQGAEVCGCAVVVELNFLEASKFLECPVISLASYEI